MRNLARISHRLEGKALTCRAVIETPRGGRSKYTYEPEVDAFALTGLIPEGMAFPLDFGFVPSTLGEDGDPLDILVLADEPAAVGALVEVRLIGVIEGQQTENGKAFRNDRLIGVATVSRLYARIAGLGDLPTDYLDQLTAFWVQYNALKGKRFEVLREGPPKDAAAAIRKATAEGAA